MGIGGGKVASGAAVFLDRDGIINKAVVRDGKPYPPASLSDLQWVEGIKELIDGVKNLGYKVFVFTNQPDVARGDMSQATVDEIHNYIVKQLNIDKVYCCFHDDKDNCHCRKPKPGMILDAQKEWSVDLGRSFVVGDRWRDIAAGQAAGVRTILVDYNYNEKKVTPDFTTRNLAEVLTVIKTETSKT